MNSINNILVTGALSLLTSIALAETTPAAPTTGTSTAPGIVGNYNCQGHDPFNNNDYNKSLTVMSTGGTFTFQWMTDKGYPTSYGTGVANTNLQNLISVAFWDAKDKNHYGTSLIQIKPDGSLQSSWTLKTENKLGTETCTKSN